MKLTIDNQERVRAYLQNLSSLYGVHIIVTICGYCHEWTGVRDGNGQHGISYGICPKCLPKAIEQAKLEG